MDRSLRTISLRGLRKLKDQLEMSLHRPYIGVTQGGSSRKWRGARVAATKGEFKPPKQEKLTND